MTGYEVIHDEADDDLGINEVIEDCKKLGNPIVDTVIRLYARNNEVWEMFYELHQRRKNKRFMGHLGVAKLSRAYRDAYGELLRKVRYMSKENTGNGT
jgi:hypothetical protein